MGKMEKMLEMIIEDEMKITLERKSMGFYIEVSNPKNKTQQILDLYGGIICINAPEWEDITSDEAIICIVGNGSFEAAGLCIDKRELEYFKVPDGRPRQWLIMSWQKACQLTGFNEEEHEY